MISKIKKLYYLQRKDNIFLYSATLGYYAVFYLGPMFFVILGVAGLFFGKPTVQKEFTERVSQVLGYSSAGIINDMIEESGRIGGNNVVKVISILILVFGATQIFSFLRFALDAIWKLELEEDRGVRQFFWRKFFSFFFVLLSGLIFLLLIGSSVAVGSLANFLGKFIFISSGFIFFTNIGIFILLAFLLLAIIYKFLPDFPISWRNAFRSALFSAFFLSLGNLLLSLLIRHTSFFSTEGALGSLLLILIWIYYSAQIFFLGVEYSKIYQLEK